MELGLKNKRALVTGASTGLGRAAATALAAEGARVIINSRNQDKLTAAASAIEEKTGAKPDIVVGDLSRPNDIKKIVAAAGDVDILVSNTGGPPPGPLNQHSQEQWRAAADLLLHSAISLTTEIIEGMKQRGWGRLIYITSVAVLQPIDDLILSNTFRAGLTAFCKTVSNTYARYGITANTVCPGYTATERLWDLARNRAEQAGKTAEDVMEEFGSGSPVGRVGQPEEPAALITFLAGEKAAYITGVSIPVDGGMTKALI